VAWRTPTDEQQKVLRRNIVSLTEIVLLIYYKQGFPLLICVCFCVFRIRIREYSI